MSRVARSVRSLFVDWFILAVGFYFLDITWRQHPVGTSYRVVCIRAIREDSLKINWQRCLLGLPCSPFPIPYFSSLTKADAFLKEAI